MVHASPNPGPGTWLSPALCSVLGALCSVLRSLCWLATMMLLVMMLRKCRGLYCSLSRARPRHRAPSGGCA